MPSIVQLLRGPSCPLTVGSAKVKRERKSETRVKSENPGRGGGSKSVSCEKSKRRKEKYQGREERFLAVPLPLSDVLFLHLFFWSLPCCLVEPFRQKHCIFKGHDYF